MALVGKESTITVEVTLQSWFLPQNATLVEVSPYDKRIILPYQESMVKKGNQYTYMFTATEQEPRTRAFVISVYQFPLFSSAYIGQLKTGFTQRAVVLPPDPGPANDLTLEGIHSDHDTVRDDLQLEVFFLYPGSTRARLAWKQYLIEEQKIITSNEGKENIKQYLGKAIGSAGCTGSYRKNEIVDKQADQVSQSVNLLLLNTKVRKEKNLKNRIGWVVI